MIHDKPECMNGKQAVIFSDESRFCSQYQNVSSVTVFDGIVVNTHWQRAFVIVILAIVIVLGAIGYTFRSPLVHNDGTLKSSHYISGV
ncbi:hypothetical protein TNCV_3673551 [Trichonephila clavipes]|nr:hypothetical protein TNCV_3673551 [Trichonephila clavipes]